MMALAFLRDKQGKSPVREEWQRLWATGAEQNLVRLSVYLSDVDAFGAIEGNTALSKALQIKDNLYWFSVGDVGVVFSYDGTDLVIIEPTRFTDENTGRRKALQVAEQRI
jgi:hypothetical protein